MEEIKPGPVHILLLTMLVVFLVGLICSDQILAETTQVLDGASLIEQAKALNGQDVIFQGEIIGDIMPRQDHYWINVLNNGTAIGIWISAEQRAAINLSGLYGIQGDEVKIVGRFSQACAEHGGDLDIHASSVEIINKGMIMPQKLNIPRLITAAGLFILASCCMAFLLKHRFHSKSKHTRIR